MNRRDMLAVTAALPFAHLRAEDPVEAREIKSLNDYFPLRVPQALAEWMARKERVREQILVATGLWPMPPRPKVEAVISGTIPRVGYTIDKVHFASMPGHFVTGNLYVPTDVVGKRPGVLFAHGHWAKGRFMENDDKGIEKALATKAEATRESARYHMQAACATLARRGYVVFAYDMVGYADSTAIGHVAKSGVPHPNGFADLDGELRLQSLMGLQTFNSLRALDYLASLPNVDSKRIGMTGASGGGTQTFLTAALDDRIACAVPAVMVSTGMQGGCVCENCSLLRVGTGNVEIAALIAPRPLACTCADDWTKEFLSKGFPELRKVYELYSAAGKVQAKAWPQYPHNYNQPAREFMYAFFAKHLEGREEAVSEAPFVPLPPAELSVFDAQHPRPKEELDAARLRRTMTLRDGERKLSGEEVRKALRAMVCDELPKAIKVYAAPKESQKDGCTLHRTWFGRHDEKDALFAQGMFGPKFDGANVLLWIHADGIESLFKDDKLVPAARSAIDSGYAIVSGDLYAKPPEVNKVYAGFTFGYNRSLLAQRVHDILTLTAFATIMLKAKNLRLAGWGQAGPWTALAAALTPFAKTVADLQQFDFNALKSVHDSMMFPGALKYGGLPGLLTACAPHPLAIHNAPAMDTTAAAYKAAGKADDFTADPKPWTDTAAMGWLLK